MNRIENYFHRCAGDIKKMYSENPSELYLKVMQLNNQAKGFVRKTFLTKLEIFAEEMLTAKEATK